MTRTRDPRQHPLPIPMRSAAILAGLALALLAIGSGADYFISQGLYAPGNTFGLVLAAYGEAPALLALVAAGTLALLAQPPVHQILRWLLLIGGVLLIIAGTLALVVRPEEYWPLPTGVRTLIALVLAAGVIWAVSRVSVGAAWQTMCVLAAALFTVVAAEMVLVQGVKILWDRPRMRMLTETGAQFAPWWSPGYDERDALLAQGVDPSDFKSLPSGHTANAAVLVMLAGFGLLREDLRRHRALLFWIGGVWALVVGFSRLTIGAHFLSDVALSILVCLAVAVAVSILAGYVLSSRLLDRLPPGRSSQAPPPRHGRGTQ